MVERRPDPEPVLETVISGRALDALSRWFTITREVAGRHWSGRRFRLDAVIKPVDPTDWFDADPALGIEFKPIPHTFDTVNHTEHLRQAISYSETEWDGFGRLPIICHPSPFDALWPYGEPAQRLMAHLLGQFRVGELVEHERNGWMIRMSSSHILWDEVRGVREARRWSLRPRDGSGGGRRR